MVVGSLILLVIVETIKGITLTEIKLGSGICYFVIIFFWPSKQAQERLSCTEEND